MNTHGFELRFSEAQLRHIQDEAIMYSCGCPEELSEVLMQLRHVRTLMDDCLDTASTDPNTHARVLSMLAIVTPHIEACLGDILESEGWNMETFSLPPAVKARFLEESNY